MAEALRIDVLVSILNMLVSFGPKIPKALEILNSLIDLFGIKADEMQLESFEATPEVEQLVQKVSHELSVQSGAQQQFDLSRVRALAKFLQQNPGKLEALIRLFS